MTQSLLVTESLNSDVSWITSQVAVLVGSVKKKYMHKDIIRDFDMIQSFMGKYKMPGERMLALKRLCYGVQKHHMQKPNPSPTIKKLFSNLWVGSCGTNLSQFRVVNKLTKLLENQNFFGDYVVHVNYYPQIKLQYFCPVIPEIMVPQARHFGGENSIQAVLAILYQVLHSLYKVFWVMRLGRKI